MSEAQRFVDLAGWAGATRTPLAGDASARRYERLRQGGRSVLLMTAGATSLAPFLAVAAWLRSIGLTVPEIMAVDPPSGLMLLEDLGDDLVERMATEAEAYPLIVDVVRHWQSAAPPDFLPRLDAAALCGLIELFVERLAPSPVAAARLRHLWPQLLEGVDLGPPSFVHRDLHCRNLLWLPERKGLLRIGLLDFQDALIGPPLYDLVSLLQDARHDVPEEEVAVLQARFRRGRPDLTAEGFAATYAVLGAHRAMRILAVFDRLIAAGRTVYRDSVPRVRRHLATNLRHPALAPLARWCEEHYPCATDPH